MCCCPRVGWSIISDGRHETPGHQHSPHLINKCWIPRNTNVSLHVCVSHLLQLTMTAWDYMTCMVLRVYSSRSLRELLILSLHNHQLRNCFFSSLLTWLYPSCSDLQCQCHQILTFKYSGRFLSDDEITFHDLSGCFETLSFDININKFERFTVSFTLFPELSLTAPVEVNNFFKLFSSVPHL